MVNEFSLIIVFSYPFQFVRMLTVVYCIPQIYQIIFFMTGQQGVNQYVQSIEFIYNHAYYNYINIISVTSIRSNADGSRLFF
jgi:hypothetical protein